MQLDQWSISITVPYPKQFFSFSSMLSLGIIYWDNLDSSGKIFTLEKKFDRITVGAIPGISCRSVFTKKFVLLSICIFIKELHFK